MVYHRLPSTLLSVIALLSVTKSNGTPSKSAVRRPDADSKCYSYSTNYNYYYNSTLNTGSNKKMEALLHRVLDELREVREEIKLIKGDKTIGKYKIYYLNYLVFFLYLLNLKHEKQLIFKSPSFICLLQ